MLRTLTVFCCLYVLSAEGSALRDLTDQDVEAWSQLYGDPQLSPDGRWLAYIWSAYEGAEGSPRKGDPQLIVRATEGESERRYPLGNLRGRSPKFSISQAGHWLAFSSASAGPASTVEVLNLETFQRSAMGAGDDFQIVPGERWIAVRQNESTSARYALALHRLPRGLAKPADVGFPTSWEQVSEHAIDGQGQYLAVIDQRGLHLADLRSGRSETYPAVAGIQYSHLRWSPSGKQLAFLAEGQEMDTISVASNFHGKRLRLDVFEATASNGFPSGHRISIQQALLKGPLMTEVLRWRSEEDGLYFEIEPAGARGQPVADLAIWHWKDPYIPPQKRGASAERFLAFLSLKNNRFVMLAERSRYTNVLPQGRGRSALAFNWRAYGTANAVAASNMLSSFEKRDYAVVDVHTGKRRELASMRGIEVLTDPYWGSNESGPIRLVNEPQISPDGSHVVYMDNRGHYHVHDLARGLDRNMTENATGWISKQQQIPLFNQDPTGNFAIRQGWTADGKDFLVSDGYDIWVLPMSAGRARNLTGNGRRDGIVYQLADLFAPRFNDHSLRAPGGYPAYEAIDLRKKIFFKATQVQTMRNGLAILEAGANQARTLVWDYAAIDYYRARQAPLFIIRRSTLAEGTNFFRIDDRWIPTLQLTDLMPQRAQFRWPTGEVIEYRSPEGDARRALLFSPAGQNESTPKPTIVSVYLRTDVDTMHLTTPRTYTRFHWLKQGYAVLEPDIRPLRGSELGVSALRSTLDAVAAAVKTGKVDAGRLGLHGHSTGGYEAFYIASRTNIFKAIVPVSGISNLQSFYNGIDGTTPGSMWVENIYLSAPWWEDREAMVQASPIEKVTEVRTPMLIGHGDADDQVPFNQALEMFIALRRIQDRPVVLLQYFDSGHGVDTHPDFTHRVDEFFNHFLKGGPAPAWWEEGASYAHGMAPQPLPNGRSGAVAGR